MKRALDFVRGENLHRIALVLLLLVVAGAIGLWQAEPEMNLPDSIWWSIVTLTTVGYGDIAPQTLAGRAIGVVLMFFGIGILSMLTASIASIFVQRKLLKERGMGSSQWENHIIICQWNHRAQEILAELRADPRTADAAIVVLADIDRKPVDDRRVELVAGAVDDANLRRAGIERASTVIILGDSELPAHARDAQVVLATLAVESLNPGAHTIVELADESNSAHCRRAQADEVICGDKISSRLIASAALDHGLSHFVTELVSQSYGTNLETLALPEALVGKTFFDALIDFKKSQNATVVGVDRDSDVVSNPPVDFALRAGDRLVVLADRAGA
ncbi:MAG: ion channel [Acidobacteriota bacterium]